MDKAKQRLYKISERIRYIWWALIIISFIMPLIIKKFPLIILPIFLFILATHMLISALYFKKSLGVRGIEVGKKHDAYLYWGVAQFIFYAMFGVVLYRIIIREEYSNIIIYGIVSMVIIPLLIYGIKRLMRKIK